MATAGKVAGGGLNPQFSGEGFSHFYQGSKDLRKRLNPQFSGEGFSPTRTYYAYLKEYVLIPNLAGKGSACLPAFKQAMSEVLIPNLAGKGSAEYKPELYDNGTVLIPNLAGKGSAKTRYW